MVAQRGRRCGRSNRRGELEIQMNIDLFSKEIIKRTPREGSFGLGTRLQLCWSATCQGLRFAYYTSSVVLSAMMRSRSGSFLRRIAQPRARPSFRARPLLADRIARGQPHIRWRPDQRQTALTAPSRVSPAVPAWARAMLTRPPWSPRSASDQVRALLSHEVQQLLL